MPPIRRTTRRTRSRIVSMEEMFPFPGVIEPAAPVRWRNRARRVAWAGAGRPPPRSYTGSRAARRRRSCDVQPDRYILPGVAVTSSPRSDAEVVIGSLLKSGHRLAPDDIAPTVARHLA